MAKKIRVVLTDDEYNLLNKITRQTKTDCWFCLDTDKEGFDCVRDLERGHKVTLRFAVGVLNEAIIPDLLNVTEEEIEIYSNLLKKLKIADNPFGEYNKEVMEIYAGNANGIFTNDEEE